MITTQNTKGYTFPLSQETRDDIAMYIYQEWKSVYGVKNRWTDFDAITDEDLVAMCDHLEARIIEEINAEKAHAEKVKYARAHPEKYITAVVGYDLDDDMDSIMVEYNERAGNYSHVTIYEKPLFSSAAMASAFAKVA